MGSESLELFALWQEGIWALKDHWDDSSSSAGCWGRCELKCFQEAFLLIPGMQITCAQWLTFMVPTTYTFSNSLWSALLVLLDNWGSKTGREKKQWDDSWLLSLSTSSILGPWGEEVSSLLTLKHFIFGFLSSKVRNSSCTLLEQLWRDTPCPRRKTQVRW